MLASHCHYSNPLRESRRLADSAETQQPLLFQYHNGPLLTGKISINLIWYGKFKPSQRAIISDFIASLSSSTPTKAQPSVATWWKTTDKYYHLVNSKKPSTLGLSMGTQIIDETYSLGKSLSNQQIEQLASKGAQKNAINVVLTSNDVAVEGFYSMPRPMRVAIPPAHLWTPEPTPGCTQQRCGLGGMVINLASLLAGTTTNPFGNGYFQGPKDAPLEAASACPGVFGKGAYPGYAGDLLVEPATGASYNANGANGRKYLLPALFDPSTQTCSTLV
uniref:Uncharacterized protein n=1 Tax=Quercus lobata TaxID=97700 RepID=A0A7N2N861_QUELO